MPHVASHHRAAALVVVLIASIGLTRACDPPVLQPLRSEEPAAAGLIRGTAGMVDPNTASASELVTLPGIGPTLARRILAARATGPVFTRADDLRRVQGIGPRTLDRLRTRLAFPVPNPTRITDPGGTAPRTPR